MAFNLARYNLAPFNIVGSKSVKTNITGYETVSASIGTALQVFTRAVGFERVNETTSGEMSYKRALKGTETIREGVTVGFLSVVSYLNFLENITSTSEIVASINPPLPGTETVSGSISLGADIHPALFGAETVTADTLLSAVISTQPDGYELVSATASLEAVDMKTTFLTVTLKPGERLIVDASTYNVLLNGENAIEIHSGDWIDELTRETQSIIISAAAGAADLSATILYTERYL